MACCARTIRDAAISSIARVIFWVDTTLRMRRRMARSSPAGTWLRPAFRASSSGHRLRCRLIGGDCPSRAIARSSLGGACRGGLGLGARKALLHLGDGLVQLVRWGEGLGRADRLQQVGVVGPEVLYQRSLEGADVVHCQVVEEALRTCIDRNHLLLHR